MALDKVALCSSVGMAGIFVGVALCEVLLCESGTLSVFTDLDISFWRVRVSLGCGT